MKYKTSNNEEIEVVVIRKNNKNTYFRVKDDLKIYVTCPIFVSDKTIMNLIKENESAIMDMYNKVLAKSKDNDLFLYLGNKYHVVIDESISKVELKDNCVYAPSYEDLNKFYDSEVKRVFTEEVEIAKKCFTNLPDFTLKFRKMTSRWGVCNRSKNIVTLNTELLKKEITLLDYVIIHELCHFYEGNHSKNFWHLVGQAYPNYKMAREKLKA